MHDKPFTIVGARGYVGSRLRKRLEDRGDRVNAIDRFNITKHGISGLGHVIFAAGVTADFRVRPFDTITAHVSSLTEILQTAIFDSFLYLSSTRLYLGNTETLESTEIRVVPDNPTYLYNASKLAGEALCLAMPNRKIRVARLSNVYGADDPSQNFLSDITRTALTKNHVELRENPDSEKDFISIKDVVKILPEIATTGHHRIYNVASGRNTRYQDILSALVRHTGCTISTKDDSPRNSFPQISIDRLSEEFGTEPRAIEEEFGNFVKEFERTQT